MAKAKIKNAYDAESLFCSLFVAAGESLGLPSYGEEAGANQAIALSEDVVRVLHQCEFDDPHFIGGPGAFNFAKTVASVNKIFERAEPIALELYAALKNVGPEDAEKFRAGLDEIQQWMLKTVTK